ISGRKHRQGRHRDRNSVREHGEIVSGSTILHAACISRGCQSAAMRCPAPKGASDFDEFAVSLKRYPDTKPECDAQSAAPESGSIAPCRRSNCGRFCENADRGSTMSQPTSCAFCFKSPSTCERNPMIDVPFFSLLFSFGISVKGLAFALFKSKMIREGCSTPLLFIRSARSFSVFTNSTFTFILRPVS